MEYKEIKQLMEDMGNSKLETISIELPDGTKINMTKGVNNQPVLAPINAQLGNTQLGNTQVWNAQLGNAQVCNAQLVNTQLGNTLVDKAEAAQLEERQEYKVIKSPMVGTYFESASPKDEPFVKLGDKIHKGQVLCIVEAMKLMNEIESEYDGEIVEICVKNEEMVEYGRPLFKIK